MKYLLILAVLSLFMVAAAPGTIGTMTLTNQPVYGGEATFHVVLNKHINLVNSVVWCHQTGGDVYRVEHGLPRYSSHLETEISFTLVSQWWNPSETAYCQAVVFKERLNGNQTPTALTNWVDFEVEP